MFLALAILVALMLRLHHLQGVRLMAFSDEVIAAVNEVKAGVAEAVADIDKLHALLAGFLEVGDVASARTALSEALSAVAALRAAVAIPEPGDEPAPPVE